VSYLSPEAEEYRERRARRMERRRSHFPANVSQLHLNVLIWLRRLLHRA